jgi:hypothetical protein
LFVYAAANKVLDFQNFTQQLGQSPLLSAFAEQLAWVVPTVELMIVAFLIIPKFRYIAFVAAFVLMLMFTIYIYIILNHSVFVPCSCGGILEKLTWKEHLIFNIVFVVLAAIAVGFQIQEKKINKFIALGYITTLSLLGTGVLIVLFVLSENIVRYHNKFVRRLSNAPVTKLATIKLPYNSYYFSGADDTTVYLGNTTSQLLLTELNTKRGNIQEHRITLNKIDFPFRSVTLKVRPPYFYVYDGMVPCVFRGKLNNWKAQLYNSGTEYFSFAEPVDSTALLVRTQKRITGESILGKFGLLSNTPTILNKQLLEKQIDGVFDTDGMLLFSAGLNRMLYLYAYRNQYIVTNTNLQLDFKGNTIDTITKANIKLTHIENHNANKLARQPLLVNKTAAVYNNLLFVNSNLPGKYESLEMWKKASIIDVYDIASNSYLESFYVYNSNGKKLRNMIVHKDKLFAMIDNQVVEYKLNSILTKHYKDTIAAQRHNNLLAK